MAQKQLNSIGQGQNPHIQVTGCPGRQRMKGSSIERACRLLFQGYSRLYQCKETIEKRLKLQRRKS